MMSVIEKSSRDSLETLLDQVTAMLHENFQHYTGVYLYRLDGETLVLGPYRGRPTEHTRIPVGAGICGHFFRVTWRACAVSYAEIPQPAPFP